jgi:hypothetical protein
MKEVRGCADFLVVNPNYSQKRDRREMFENFRERGAAAGSSA